MTPELSLFPNTQGMLNNQLVFRTVEEVHQHCLTYTAEYINAVSSFRSLVLIGASLLAVALLYLLWLWYVHVPKQQPPHKEASPNNEQRDNKPKQEPT